MAPLMRVSLGRTRHRSFPPRFPARPSAQSLQQWRPLSHGPNRSAAVVKGSRTGDDLAGDRDKSHDGTGQIPHTVFASSKSGKPEHSLDKAAFSNNRREELRKGNLFDEKTQKSNLHYISLRKACTCARCVDPSDQQKNYSSAYVPSNISVKHFSKDARGNYEVTWENDVPGYDDHTSHYSAQQIHSWFPTADHHLAPSRFLEKALWDRGSFSIQNATCPYTSFMSSRQGLADVSRQLWRTGLAFISDVPKDETSVHKMADRIGSLRNTFYGPTWNVQSVPNAKNVAYTDRYLGFHMDLLYMEEPPAYQLLHCLENTCAGGESQFADTFKAIDLLASAPDGREKVMALMQCYVKFRYSNDGHEYDKAWTTIKEQARFANTHNLVHCQNRDILSRVNRVHWSPPFESSIPAVFSFEEKRNTRARHDFAKILETEQMILETRLEAGTCAIFENTRVVHARKAFDVNSGQRWLKGAYVNRQDFQSTMRGVMDLMPREEIANVDHDGAKPLGRDGLTVRIRKTPGWHSWRRASTPPQ